MFDLTSGESRDGSDGSDENGDPGLPRLEYKAHVGESHWPCCLVDWHHCMPVHTTLCDHRNISTLPLYPRLPPLCFN